MTFLTDLFNPTFLMFLGIFILVILLLVVYFESKLREQNHKIASMLSLVSSLAEELNGVKFGLNHLSMRGGTTVNPFFPQKHLAQNNILTVEKKLIEVSDNDSDDDSDDDSDSDSDSDNDSDSDSVNDSDNDNDNDSEIDSQEDVGNDENTVFTLIEQTNCNEVNETKVLKLNEDEATKFGEFEIEDFDDNLSLSSKSSRLSIKQLNKIFDSQHHIEENADDVNINSLEELKTININLEEQNDSLDYKKLSLSKLRSIVSEKGLSVDSSKLKKNELLKLLGVE